MTTPTRLVLRYHGGKWRLAPWIIQHMPAHRIYVEPFGGAASVLLRKPRSYSEVYNDLDGEVVNVFCVLRDEQLSRDLEKKLRLTLFSRDEFKLAYIPVDDPVERARRTIARSHMGFGSSSVTLSRNVRRKDQYLTNHPATGFRANSNRSGTTAAHDWMHYPELLDAYVERLRGVVIENRPAGEVIAQHDREDCLFYVDPPYVSSSRDSGSDYRHEMTDDDHRALAAQLHQVNGMVLLSGYPSALYDELYADWRCVTRKALADGARERTECLWLNAACSSRLHGRLFEE